MDIPIYHVNAFTNHLFSGNPAAVCVQIYPLSEKQLLAIVVENNLPATVFLQKYDNGYFIRWFTPNESNLCGHGTLAAAFVIFKHLEPSQQQIQLKNQKSGLIINIQQESTGFGFPLPLKKPQQQALPPDLANAFNGVTPRAFYGFQQERCLVIFDHQSQIETLKTNMDLLKSLPYWGYVATAPGDSTDFVSRTFYPHKPIPFQEDPVTGASHCVLAAFWEEELNRKQLTARQLSKRGGFVNCTVDSKNNQLYLQSNAVLYSQGLIQLACS